MGSEGPASSLAWMRSTEREDDDRYRSASFAHSSHCCHATSSWTLAASSVGAWP